MLAWVMNLDFAANLSGGSVEEPADDGPQFVNDLVIELVSDLTKELNKD